MDFYTIFLAGGLFLAAFPAFFSCVGGTERAGALAWPGLLRIRLPVVGSVARGHRARPPGIFEGVEMDPKSIDNEQAKAEREAAREYKRLLDEGAEEAVRLMREKRVHFPEPDARAAAESEGEYTRRFRKHVGSFGIRAMLERPE